MIEVRGLTKKFGTLTAVGDISFKVSTGSTLAIVGTSGCGKTTLLKMINRLIEPTSGEIYINQENVLELSSTTMRRSIGYVIQDIGLFPHYTVEENIAVVPKLLKWDKEASTERVYQLMHTLGLPPDIYAQKFPDQLSGGQQQRVGIARALAANPPIILMDEPFGALDPVTRRSIRKEFKELEELSSKTTLMITHDIEEAFEMADQVLVLDKGTLQQMGTPKELLFDPANEFVIKFLAEQKLNLELEVITLGDIFDRVKNLDSLSGIKIIDLSTDINILSAITHLAHTSSNTKAIRVTEDEREKIFNISSLMDAFYQVIN